MDEDVAADLRSAVTGGGRWPLFLGFRTPQGKSLFLHRSVILAIEALPNPDTCRLHLTLPSLPTLVVTDRGEELVRVLDPEPQRVDLEEPQDQVGQLA